VSNVASVHECASAKAAKQASVQEPGPTPARVMSWRQADSTPSGSIAKTDPRSARHCAKVSHAWATRHMILDNPPNQIAGRGALLSGEHLDLPEDRLRKLPCSPHHDRCPMSDVPATGLAL
jgi:hypothetical protein